MPCLEISMPEQDQAIRAKLVQKLTEVFEKYSGYDVKAFGIRFYEYSIGRSANGGAIWDGNTGKPYIHLKLDIPIRTIAEKKDLIAGFTEVFTECLGKPEWTPVIYINEYSNDNIGYDGFTLSDHKPD